MRYTIGNRARATREGADGGVNNAIVFLDRKVLSILEVGKAKI